MQIKLLLNGIRNLEKINVKGRSYACCLRLSCLVRMVLSLLPDTQKTKKLSSLGAALVRHQPARSASRSGSSSRPNARLQGRGRAALEARVVFHTLSCSSILFFFPQWMTEMLRWQWLKKKGTRSASLESRFALLHCVIMALWFTMV